MEKSTVIITVHPPFPAQNVTLTMLMREINFPMLQVQGKEVSRSSFQLRQIPLGLIQAGLQIIPGISSPRHPETGAVLTCIAIATVVAAHRSKNSPGQMVKPQTVLPAIEGEPLTVLRATVLDLEIGALPRGTVLLI